MKVIFCTHDGKNIINGVNTWLLRLLPRLKEKGITIKVIAIAWAPEDECTTIPLLQSMGIQCSLVKAKRYTEREIKWILEYINKESPDIFIANNMYQAWYASKWIGQAGIPVVGVLHSDNEESEERIKAFAADKNGYLIEAIVAVSDVLYNNTLKYQDKIKIKRISCGIPIVNEKSFYKSGQTFKIAYVGRLELYPKKIDDITRAFCETVQYVPDTKAYIYGDGPDVQIVKNIINEYGCNDRVILKGNIPNDQLTSELLDMHIITLMSVYEGLPVSLIEAMSVGVVPVCKHIPSGIPELLIEGINGFYIETTNDFADRVNYLKSNPEIWESLSVNAKSHIKEGYSIEECVTQWIALFNELDTSKKTKIKIPFRITLPPVNTGISADNNREPGVLKKALRKIKRELTK